MYFFKVESPINIHIYENSKNFYSEKNIIQIPNALTFTDSYYAEKTDEIVILTQCKLKILDVKTNTIKIQMQNADLRLNMLIDCFCKMNDNYLLIATHNNFYFYNILYHQFDTIIRQDKKISGINLLKSDLNGNIYLIGNNYNFMEDSFKPKNYFFVYRYKEMLWDKIYENEFRKKKIEVFEPLNDNNKFAFIFSYCPFFSEDPYLQIENVNI